MFQIRFTKLNIEMEVMQNGLLPKDKASGIRGVIGQALQENTCVWNQQCEACKFQKTCIFYNVFHSQFQIQPYFTFSNDSVGYIISCLDNREYYHAGEYLRFSITLFGNTIPYFSPLLHALSVIEIKGLGKHHIPLRLSCIKNRNGKPILTEKTVNMEEFQIETLSEYIQERKQSEVHTIWLQSPCAIQVNHSICLSPTVEQIVKNLFRRLYMLNCYEGNYVEPYCPIEIETNILSQDLQIRKITRYSNHQKQSMQLKGIQGIIQTEPIKGKAKDILLAGEIIHIGKNTSFGFGKIQVQ